MTSTALSSQDGPAEEWSPAEAENASR
jgi:hypothetical protein